MLVITKENYDEMSKEAVKLLLKEFVKNQI